MIFEAFLTFVFLILSVLSFNRKSTSSLQPQSLMYPDTLHWGIFKPYLLYSLTERSSTPLVLRMGVTSQESGKIMMTMREWKGNAYYEYHNGISFASQKIFIPNDFEFTVNFWKENYSAINQAWRTVVSFPNSPNNKMLVFCFSLSAEAWGAAFSSKSIHLKAGALEVRDDNKLFAKFIPSVLDSKEEKIRFYGVKTEGKNYHLRIKDHMESAYFGFLQEAEEGKEYTGIIVKIELLPNENSMIDLAYSEFSKESQMSFAVETQVSALKTQIMAKKENFNVKFSLIFPSKDFEKCSRISLCNLLGGLVYENGPIFYRESKSYEDPKPLFSATPCRTEFPRGFLWDEGFHQSIICHFSPVICMSALKSWFDTTWADGWIPREQIRGPETEEYANKRYLSQTKDEANPPTLLFPLEILAKEMKIRDPIVMMFFSSIYPKLKLWFQWFHSSSKANQSEELFKWKEREPGLYLGSGLDDYPRGNSKYHIDLQCWIIFFAQKMSNFAAEFDSEIEILKIRKIFENAKKNLFIHFLDKDGLFKDVTDEGFSEHLGYITILPLALGFIEENSKEFNATLALITNPDKLWSNFGLRSLSKSDEFFGKGENYWRGRIWVPFNYLLLRGLKLFYCKNEEAMRVYSELRMNLLRNVCNRFEETQYFFENYESESGEGSYNHPFNGWTSLITLIASEKYQ